MTHTKQGDAHWLVSDANRAKALIKYDIKQQESLLKHYLADGTTSFALTLDDAMIVCESLRQRYGDYLHAIGGDEAGDFSSENDHVQGDTVAACYEHIQFLKQQFIGARTTADAIQHINALGWQYQHLRCLLARNAVQSVKKADGMNFSRAIEPLVQANSPTDWLQAVVQFVNQSELSLADQLSHMSTLDNQHVLHLSRAFNQPDYLRLMSDIFFCKLYPQRLFKQALHPEKLVSVKSRLSLLYEVIEMLHQALVQTLVQRGLQPIQDYLFHGEELPQGIEMTVGDDSLEVIQLVIKSLRMNLMLVNECQLGVNQLDEVFRAYKFWFNPNRLIDAVMILDQKTSSHGTRLAADDSMHQLILTIYRQRTTTECLDLYGYFANKDSSYLMRTLLVLKGGIDVSWLPTLTQVEKNAVQRVYHRLEWVMNALRDELATRHITTAPYNRALPAKPITPGRRNRNAVARIITLYGREDAEINAKIEQLFSAVETED